VHIQEHIIYDTQNEVFDIPFQKSEVFDKFNECKGQFNQDKKSSLPHQICSAVLQLSMWLIFGNKC
jgi:hypothetical protein